MERIISCLLSEPIIFNFIRRIIAGNQKNTKDFVRSTLESYRVKTVLDIGCGTGDFVETIPEKTDYLGIDVDRKFIFFAKENYQNKKRKFLARDINKKEFLANKMFDATLLISMLHHLSDDELERILPLIKVHTKKVVIVADIIPNPNGILKKIMVKFDRGKFIRTKEEKVKILSKYFKLIKITIVPSKLAVQLGVICEA